jgi:phosphatidylglycerophosphate synthase
MGPADWITAVRAALATYLAFVLMRPSLPDPMLCVTVASVAALLDGVDGWVARRTGTASEFGARFDMETDALLILVLAALVVSYDKAGPWILASGLLRYGFVAAGWIWPWMRRPLESSRRRQTLCVIQIAALIVALLPALNRTASEAIAAASLAALVWSFLVDILWLWQRRASRPLFSSSTRR